MASPHRDLDLRGAVLALLLSALWGGNPIAIKVGLLDAPPFWLGSMRFVLVWSRDPGLGLVDGNAQRVQDRAA